MVKLQGSAQDLAELAAAECEGCWAMPSLGSEGWPAAPESSSVDDEILLFFSHERRSHFDCAEKSTKSTSIAIFIGVCCGARANATGNRNTEN